MFDLICGCYQIHYMVKLDEKVLAALCRTHGVESLRVFGSAARDEERSDSDIDLLVRFSETKSLLELVRIEREFSEHFGRPVDLVTEEELSPHIRDEVLLIAATVYGDGSVCPLNSVRPTLRFHGEISLACGTDSSTTTWVST